MFRVIALCLVALSVHSTSGQCNHEKQLAVNEMYEFRSPGYSAYYAKNLDCKWTITAPIGNKVTTYCSDFVIPGNNCNLDVFSLNNYKYCTSNPIYARTASNVLVASLKTTTNQGRFYCKATTEPDHCNCGRRKNTKIVGGEEANLHEFPYQAYLQDSKGVRCSATIISPSYAMTAAHCVTGQKAADLKLVVGDHDTVTGSETNYTATHSINTLIPHANYNSDTGHNDIALIRLNKDIEYNDAVGPVCLPWKFRNNKFENDPVTVAGWGATEFGGPLSKKLQKVDLRTTTQTRCKADNPKVDIDTTICTFAPEKDSCQNDSGGSIYYTDPSNSRVYSIGVVSGGAFCGGSKASFNTRVTSQLDWISNNAVGAQFCTV